MKSFYFLLFLYFSLFLNFPQTFAQAGASSIDIPPLEAEDLLKDPEIKKQVEQQSLYKLNSFENCLGRISDKKKSDQDRQNAIGEALELFINGKQTVEVSYVGNCPGGFCKKEYPIRAYLNRLLLKGSEVIIKFEDVFVEKIESESFQPIPNKPGEYKGALIFTQIYTEKDNNGNFYQDITKKRIEIYCKMTKLLPGKPVKSEPVVKEGYTVHLGSVIVIETKLPKDKK